LSKQAVNNLPRLRIADAADTECIVRLVNAAFQVERFFLDADRINADEVRARLAAGKFILADDDGSLVGCVYVEPKAGRAYLGLLSVDPARQRSGIGRHLMSAAEGYCRNAGSTFMDLRIVNLRTELPPFYRRLGYVENGTAPFPEEANPKLPCHFVIMTKPLS
jgi:GNAT superfamily N-acetyltransferase